MNTGMTTTEIAGSLPAELVAARSVGQLCGTSATDDITDASITFTARQLGLPGHHSDPDDIRRIDNRLDVVPI
jgi:hypothetical protein